MEASPDTATRKEAGGRRGSPWRAAGVVLVGLYAAIGIGLIVAALPGEPLSPPQPEPAAAPPFWTSERGHRFGEDEADGNAPTAQEPEEDEDAGWGTRLPFDLRGMERSRPVAIRIPAIGVDAPITPVGVDEQGMIEVPPVEQADLAAWYELGPSPGEVGNAVVVGHVDSYLVGKGVFFDLGALRPGDRVEILREDGTVAGFVVDGVASFPKDTFPTELVYGASDRPGLRLITCGGRFNRVTRDYSDNVIVFATLDEASGGRGDELVGLDDAEGTPHGWIHPVPLDESGATRSGGIVVHPRLREAR